MDIEGLEAVKNISYFRARDPSLLAWNRGALQRVNLEQKFEDEAPEHEEKQDDNHIHVFLRIKGGVPYGKVYEVKDDTFVCKIPEGSYCLRNVKDGDLMTRLYTFSGIFEADRTQVDIFNSIVKSKVLDFINGKNSTLFTYGASGSGKTFTIIGTPDEPGIVPRALEYVFRTIPKLTARPEIKPLPHGNVKRLDENSFAAEYAVKSGIINATLVDRSTHIRTYKQMQERLSSQPVALIEDISSASVSLWVSYAEIYNENIYDLLKNPPKDKQRPKLQLGRFRNETYIKDLSIVHVSDGLEAYQVLQYGLHNLKYAATAVNSHSSRSHSIFTIRLVQSSTYDEKTSISNFHFCDLAGSERVKKTLNLGDRLKESNNINKSLLVLGRCIENIKSLQQLKDNRLIPFRESKLTQIFQRALLGEESISLIVNINPSRDMFDETQHVLNFSAIAKEIVVEEKLAKITKVKNRFSQLVENKNPMLTPNRQARENAELERLKILTDTLYNELEHQKVEAERELMEEKQYMINEYRKYIEERIAGIESNHAKEISKLREEYERKIQKMKQSEVINVSDSSTDDSVLDDQDMEEQLKSEKICELEETIAELQMEKFKENNIICQYEKLQQENRNDKILLHEAETAYLEFRTEIAQLREEICRLKSENIRLKEHIENLELLRNLKSVCPSEDDEEEEISEKVNGSAS